MIDNLLRIVFGNVNNSNNPNRQEEDTIPDDIKMIVDNTDPEVKLLEMKFGEMRPGLVIEISLQEILHLIPRKRPKADAYNSLVKKLKAEYEVSLIITSRKSKKV